MSITEMAALIGTQRHYRATHSLDFLVRVVDVRTRYGTVDVLVHPVAGGGEQWVSLDKTDPARP